MLHGWSGQLTAHTFKFEPLSDSGLLPCSQIDQISNGSLILTASRFLALIFCAKSMGYKETLQLFIMVLPSALAVT